MKDNLVSNTFRLNMNNPKHVKINKVIKNLNPKIYKSINQFMVDALDFYIDHYGDEKFMKSKRESERTFVTHEEINIVKKELMQAAMTEARREVIRLLGDAISGAKGNSVESSTKPVADLPIQQDDAVFGYAMQCMNEEEGE